MKKTTTLRAFSMGCTLLVGTMLATPAVASTPSQVPLPGSEPTTGPILIPVRPLATCKLVVDSGHVMLLAEAKTLPWASTIKALELKDYADNRVFLFQNIPLQPVDDSGRLYAMPAHRLSSEILWGILFDVEKVEVTLEGYSPQSCDIEKLDPNAWQSGGSSEGLNFFGSCPDCVLMSACYCLEEIYGTEVDTPYCDSAPDLTKPCSGAVWLY